MYLENNLASKIQQSQHYTFERAVEGASPYNAEIMQILNTGDTRSPLQLFGLVYSSAKSLRSLRIYVLLWGRKAVQILYSDINFI